VVSKALREERQQPRRWFYLSFVDNSGFLGAAVVRAQGELTAVQRTKDLGIYPLGPDAYIPNDVMCTPLNWRDMKRIPKDLRDRLLTEGEVRERLEGKRVDE
jgi:hypothetical protein